MGMRLALSGKQGAGKTALAKVFIERYGFKHLSFAKAVKQTGIDEYGLTWEQAFGKEKDRITLQNIGQEKRQKEGLDYWVKKVVEEISQDPDANYVIDDVRYKNEFDILKENGFIMIRVLATEKTRKSRIGERFDNPTHISETDLDDVSGPFHENTGRIWDVIIGNETPSLNKFLSYADTIYNTFLNEPEKG